MQTREGITAGAAVLLEMNSIAERKGSKLEGKRNGMLQGQRMAIGVRPEEL